MNGRRRRKSWSKAGASSSPRTRSATSSSAPKARSTPAAATARASAAADSGSSATPQPVRGPARHEGGRAARPGRCAPRRPPTRPASTARSSASTPKPATAGRQPDARQRRRKRAADRRLRASATRSASPSTRLPDEVYVGNVGWLTFEEIDRFDPSSGTPLQLRLALLRGAGAPARSRRHLGCSAKASTRNAGAAAPPFFSTGTRKGDARRSVPRLRGLGDLGVRLLRRRSLPAVLPRQPSSSPTPCAAAST